MDRLPELPEWEDPNIASLIVLIDDEALHVTEQLVDTGLQVLIDPENRRVILPFHDEMTAEEVARIITGTIKRNQRWRLN